MKNFKFKKGLVAVLVVPMMMNGIVAHASEPASVKDKVIVQSDTEDQIVEQEYVTELSRNFYEELNALIEKNANLKLNLEAVQDEITEFEKSVNQTEKKLSNIKDEIETAKEEFIDIEKREAEQREIDDSEEAPSHSFEEHIGLTEIDIEEYVSAMDSKTVEPTVVQKEESPKTEVTTVKEAEAALEEVYGEEIDFAEFNAPVELAKVTTTIYEQTVLLNHIDTYYRLTFGNMIVAPRNNETTAGVAKAALEKAYPGVALTKEFLASEYKTVSAAREKNIQKKNALEAYIKLVETHDEESSTSKIPLTADSTNVLSLLALLGVSVAGIYTSKKYLYN